MRKFALLIITSFTLASCDQRSASFNADENMVADDSEPKFPCKAIENLLATAEDCADLTAMKEDVKPGPAALDAPATMVRGDSYEVTLIIDRPEPPPPPPPPPAPS